MKTAATALLALTMLPHGAASDQDPGPPKVAEDELKCVGIWYDSTACACKKSEGKCCACDKCTGGAECPCLEILNKGTGIIKGRVKSPWFKRIEGCVFIREIPAGKFALPRVNPVMDQKNLVFTPHVLPILAGSTVDFPNSDSVRHNVYSARNSAKEFNLGTYAAGETKQVRFETVGVVTLLCNVHAEMNAYVVVCQNPYFARVNKTDGGFEIRHVPPGTYKLGIFHEKVTAEDLEVTVEAGKTVDVELKKFGKR